MDFNEYAKSKQTVFCLELERAARLLELAGNPDKRLKIIHVAGTNGKGSVCAMIEAGLIEMGFKTGRFSSPELFDITDTITVNCTNIAEDELNSIYSFLAPLCDVVESETGKMPSQFEVNFVASLMHFANSDCKYAILECGMGGKGDATNIIADSLISIITKISLDHTSFLGNSPEEIAANKCGIFKKSSKIVTGFQSAQVMNVIRKEAGERMLIEAQNPESVGFEGFNEIFNYGCFKELKCSLCGAHQIHNAALAIEALKLLGAGETEIRYAISNTKNPARFEKVSDRVYFDGGHNPDGVRSLVESLNRYRVDGKIIFAIGMMADKDIEGALSCLKKLKNQNFEIYTCRVNSNPRSESAEKLADIALKLGFKAKAFSNIDSACENAEENCDFLIIFGSLYMYKELTRYVR